MKNGIGGLLVKAVAGTAMMTGIALGGAGTAQAGTHQIPLHYSCAFPEIGDRPVSGMVNWDYPDTATAGKPTPSVPFTMTIQVSASDVEAAHRYLGVDSASGDGAGQMTVSPSQENIPPFWVSGTAPNTSVPASGSITVVVSGTFPSLTPTRAGAGTVSIGEIVMHITPRDASGNVTYLGTVTATCTPDSGQNTLLASIQVNPAAPQSATTAPSSAATAPATGSPAAPPAPAAPPPPPSSSPAAPPVGATPAPTRTAAVSPPEHSPTGADIAIIGGSALAAAGGATALVRWLTRIRP